MLRIVIEASELWDEASERFISGDRQELLLEHSLISISKWESKWKKPFLTDNDKTTEEVIDYVRCMTLNKNVPKDAYLRLSRENLERITEYINDSKTATTFSKRHRGGGREIVTSEVIYYWMVSFNIPVEFEKWHLSRLLTLIEVCSVKSQPPKKMSKRDVMSRNASLNAARRAKLNSKG